MPNNLDQSHEGREVKVVDIQGGPEIRQRLSALGIHPGDMINVLRYGALGGPVLIEIHGSQVALGREIASKITVEESDEDRAGGPTELR